ncbi:hypothetical protein B0T21DRAFT_365677 [Apiosordaria backusii]|uniref:HMG box domain-containing protein n=1 Tax=Apiosordaria backusii TaxID=314023 RepID=A0AA40EGI3_9PEZI|nr:hypothetical protein B0T21DRAFT_365677 [Apiosordaria backusii]
MLSSIGLATARRVRVIGMRSVFSSLVRTSTRTVAVCNRGFAAAASRSATKTATATTTKKTTATKKPAAKKTTAAAPKKKAATTTKKKATAKKAAPKKKVGRKKKAPEEVPEELKIYRKAKELRVKGLIKEQPTLLPATPWLVYLVKNADYQAGSTIIDASRALKTKFESLSDAEKQVFVDEAHANKVRNDATIISWATTYPVETIEAANRARSALRRLGRKSRSSIPDPRRPKGTRTAFSYYVTQRYQSGDFNGIPIRNVMPACASEWKTMSEAERKPFIDAYKADAARYKAEREALSPSP